jgi:hypothetical protein
MGILRQGVLGGFRKKTGTVVGASHRGQDIIRGLPRISKKAPSKGQLDQRTKYGLVKKFLNRISHPGKLKFSWTHESQDSSLPGGFLNFLILKNKENECT